MALTWNEQLKQQLTQAYNQREANALYTKYASAFPAGYNDDHPPKAAVDDIRYIEQLSKDKTLSINLYYGANKPGTPLHLRLFRSLEPIPLSDILPMLENMGLRVYTENSYRLTLNTNELVWISDFTLAYQQSDLDLGKIKSSFEEAFTNIYTGLSENDGFNRLILGASITWRDILILRAYAKYLKQAGFRFSQAYIETTLAANPLITVALVALFNARLDPAQSTKRDQVVTQIEKKILSSLESVVSLDQDRILRRLYELIKATLRTNYYQLNIDGASKHYFSLKLSSHDIPELPQPVPLYEIFVYSPRFEGIHLRNAKVARGGIRWSDRREDFRTEVLGLMKAQKVKNAVIVPSGAKGGFVLKALPANAPRETTQREVIECYQAFIRGLLDLTDNIKEKSIIKPPRVVCHDDADPYLVVAADKGTATFSDIANQISEDYGFWLGDAFASGGSTGYDHKKMGITARGAWESIKRHFRELNKDLNQQTITVVGIGDMSGDVFGNGMLYTKRIRLVAAFDHRHIFIDPDPDPELSYYERLRLFGLPTSSWEDYNPKLISKGGGVFKRSLKSITLTPQIKHILDVDTASLSPNELIRAILKAPVDLLFNGGIGTYVKATNENHIDVGDRSNDYCRVNGGELRCKIVGEGGNLGFTQLGRVEYALTGGLINTDFIDNSAGVDCSDHEVNLKILLDHEVQKGRLSHKNRNATLTSVTQEVSDLVLADNYHQALVMSFSAYHASRNIGLHQSYIKELTSLGVLNRKIEFLPDDKTMLERKSSGIGLTRPELAVLLAYSKIHLKNEILKTNLTEDGYLSHIVDSAFPPSLHKKYHHAMSEHRLHTDIIATELSNHLINQMGFTFVYRLQIETGATVEEIMRAYTIASHIFGTTDLQKSVEALDFKVPMEEQYDMLFHIRNLLNIATRWFLHSPYLKDDLQNVINKFAKRIAVLEPLVPQLMSGHTRHYLETLIDKFSHAGLSKQLASRIAAYRAMYTTLNIIDVATKFDFDLQKTAKVYFSGGEIIHLVWFRDQIAADARDGHWNILARLTLRDELDICQRAFTVAVMKSDHKKAKAEQLIQEWTSKNQRALARWERLLEMMHSSTQVDYSMYFIAMRELLGLIVTSQEGAVPAFR